MKNETHDKQETPRTDAFRSVIHVRAGPYSTADWMRLLKSHDELERELVAMTRQRDGANEDFVRATQLVDEAREYGRLNADRAETFQQINGDKNTEIDNLREQLATAKADIRARNERDSVPSATRDSVIEECAKIIDRKGQDLTNEYCHGDAGPDGYTWTNKEAEWQVILLGELVEEFRALKSSYVGEKP